MPTDISYSPEGPRQLPSPTTLQLVTFIVAGWWGIYAIGEIASLIR